MKKFLLGSLLCGGVFYSFNTQADCFPSPDCAELGYTVDASKCDGVALKCPWDTSKASCTEQKTQTDTPKATCESVLASRGKQVTTAAEFKTANANESWIWVMNDIDLGSDIQLRATTITWPGELSECSDYERPTVTAKKVTLVESVDMGVGVKLKATEMEIPANGDYLFTDVDVTTLRDNNGSGVDFHGNVTVGKWIANLAGGYFLFGADGTYLGVMGGDGMVGGRIDSNRIIKIVINGFENAKGGAPYGAGTLPWDNVEVTMPANMFASIYKDIDLEYNGSLKVTGSVTSCGPAVVSFGDFSEDNKTCATINGKEICPFLKKNCSSFTYRELGCRNGDYYCQ